MRAAPALVIAAAALAGAAQLSSPLAAQEPAAPAPDSAPAPPVQTELVFEREVFGYPTFARRNPFRPLLMTDTGPRFEQMRLRGIIYSPVDPSRSVALIGVGDPRAQQPQGQPDPAAGAALTEVQDTMIVPVARTQRLKVGESWGNLRVIEIQRDNVVVEVEEFGLTERRIMRLPTRGTGGSR